MSAEKQNFHGTKQSYLNEIKRKYKTWNDVYEKDNTFAYIASDTWKPECNTGIFDRRLSSDCELCPPPELYTRPYKWITLSIAGFLQGF